MHVQYALWAVSMGQEGSFTLRLEVSGGSQELVMYSA